MSIIEALQQHHAGEAFDVAVVDIFKDYCPRPFNRFDRFYTQITKTPAAWKLSYQWTDSRHRAEILHQAFWPYVHRAADRLIDENESDLIVSTHFGSNALLRALGPRRPPFVTVVTDLVTTHALWYDRRVDLCLVPTEEARRRALECGMRPSQVQVTGLPVSAAFTEPLGDRAALRRQLGWPEHLPVALLMGGGDGLGPVFSLAKSIAHAGLPLALAVVAGRNERLQRRLEAQHWPVPTYMYGFTRDMPQFMAASDVLLTKAGPGTLCEAFHVGLPVILYHCIPGQEEGNVRHVVNGGAGVWAPHVGQAVEALTHMIEDPQARCRMSAASLSLARPGAARQIADVVAQLARASSPSVADVLSVEGRPGGSPFRPAGRSYATRAGPAAEPTSAWPTPISSVAGTGQGRGPWPSNVSHRAPDSDSRTGYV